MTLVLIVDDSPIDRAMAGGLFRKYSQCDVVYANDGAAGLDRGNGDIADVGCWHGCLPLDRGAGSGEEGDDGVGAADQQGRAGGDHDTRLASAGHVRVATVGAQTPDDGGGDHRSDAGDQAKGEHGADDLAQHLQTRQAIGVGVDSGVSGQQLSDHRKAQQRPTLGVGSIIGSLHLAHSRLWAERAP